MAEFGRALVFELTGRMIRRGVFHSVDDLVAAIEEFMRVHNHDPKPFVWTATAESILAKVQRGLVGNAAQSVQVTIEARLPEW